jgi:hypothetical protein
LGKKLHISKEEEFLLVNQSILISILAGTLTWAIISMLLHNVGLETGLIYQSQTTQ